MPIFKGTTKMKAAYKGTSSLAAIYKGSYLVWLKKFLDTISGTTPLSLPKATADPIDEANIYGMTEQRRLPSGYTEVEWIKSNKDIDLGIKTNDNIQIEAKFLRSTTSTQFVYHSDSSSSLSTTTTAYASANGIWRFGNKSASISQNVDVIFETIQNKDGVWFNGEKVGSYTGVNTFTSSSNLCALGGASSLSNQLYYLKVKEYGSNTYDYIWIPCKRTSDNSYGLYDIVGNEFYTNSEATITAGENAAPTPDNPMPIHCNNGELKVSPNLFNGQFNTGWAINSYDGSIIGISDRMSFYIPVKAGQTYTISRSAVGSSSYFYYGTYALQPYSNYQQCVSYGNIGIDALTGTITVPTGANYLAFFFGAGTSPNVQVEYGSTATSYMPYGQVYVDGDVETIEIDTTGDTATAENLLAIDTYKDVQDLISGSVTRNVGILVLDGTESWTVSTNYSNVYQCNVGFTSVSTPKCTHFVGVNANRTIGNVSSTPDGIKFETSSTSRVFINIDSIGTTEADLVSFLAQQYANGTPVIVVYPLSTPTTTTVASQELECQEGTNIVSSNKGAREMEITYWRN